MHGIGVQGRTTRVVSLAFIVAFVAVIGARADASTGLVRNIDRGGSSTPQNLFTYKGKVYFDATDGTHGGLWRSGGTKKSTRFFAPVSGDNFAIAGTELFFRGGTATDLDSEVWTSDGTKAGTVRVADINPSGPSRPPVLPFGADQKLVTMGANVYFAADDGTYGTELWTTDGTTTARLSDINTSGDSDPAELTVVGDTLFFRATDGSTGLELYSYTVDDGVQKVKDIRSAGGGSATPEDLTAFNGKVFFSARDDTDGRELWQSDGTATGTTIVADLNTGSGDSNPTDLTRFTAPDGAHLYFSANGTLPVFGAIGTQLWRTDGTTTEKVYVINPSGSSDPVYLTALGTKLIFGANDGAGYEPWVSDGVPCCSTGGTHKIKTINQTGSAFGALGNEFIGFKRRVYFIASSASDPNLWSTDGTESGTTQLGSVSVFSPPFAIDGKRMLFAGTNTANDTELWQIS
jgi:ELWxxDGT repeat protein